MSLFVSATTPHRDTARLWRSGLTQRGSGSDVSIASFRPAAAPAASPAGTSSRVGMSPSAAQFLSRLTPSSAGANQSAAGVKATAADPTSSDDTNLSSVFASLEADLADLVSGLGAGSAKAAGGGHAPGRANLHHLLQALDADSAGGPSALTGSTLG